MAQSKLTLKHTAIMFFAFVVSNFLSREMRFLITDALVARGDVLNWLYAICFIGAGGVGLTIFARGLAKMRYWPADLSIANVFRMFVIIISGIVGATIILDVVRGILEVNT